ncbi:hypothetical protein BD410DRAFT_900585 [Rickenella mellea]|uniref:Uncharacterized protein n=1 Tax=Rickenella mellea TaxID=50990 RepID=A0A4Y7PWH0_9AGAM|nr:hypothetical protein BD410DRAFT_900585 [Rickenella mellea]
MFGRGLSLLPNELILEIFSLSLPDIPSHSHTHAPLLLTHVCRAWRNFCLSAPTLWAKILIPAWKVLPRDIDKLLKLWLDRSGRHSLDIRLSVVDKHVQIIPHEQEMIYLHKVLQDIVDVLAPHRARFRVFEGVLPESLITKLGLEKMVILQHLDFGGMFFLNTEQSPVRLASQQTPLQTLSLYGVGANLDTICFQSNLNRLELVNINPVGELSAGRALNMFQCLPLLETCVIELTGSDVTLAAAPLHHLLLPSLKYFFLTWTSYGDVDPLLSFMFTPNLQRLGLRGPYSYGERWCILKDFLARSNAPITHLSLGDVGAADIQMLDCLRNTPLLSYLAIYHGPVSPSVLLGLHINCDESDRTILPNLETLNLGACDEFEADDLILLLRNRGSDMADPRFKTLRKVKVLYCSGVGEDHRAAFLASGIEEIEIDTGMNFTVPFERGFLPFVRLTQSHEELFSAFTA